MHPFVGIDFVRIGRNRPIVATEKDMIKLLLGKVVI